MNHKLLLLSIIFFSYIFLSAKHAPQKVNTDSDNDSGLLSRAVGQMMMVKFKGSTVDENSFIVQKIREYHIGGIILDNYREPHADISTANIVNPAQLKTLTKSLQHYSIKYNGYPLFIALNQEGGLINTLKPAQGFNNANDPSQFELGKTNQKNIYDQTLKRAFLLKEAGINVNLAPVADLNINPANPAVGKLQRSFGSNPKEVTQDLQSAIKAYQTAGILCTLKHFPGLGSANKNTDYDKADLSQTWNESELIPYQNLINSGINCPFIMTSHLINRKLDRSGIPASLSKIITTDLLVKKMHYPGLIITDDMDAVSVRNQYSTRAAIEKAVLAGNNILIYGGTQGHDADEETVMLFNTLLELAKKNPEVRKKVIESYERILRVKEMMRSIPEAFHF